MKKKSWLTLLRHALLHRLAEAEDRFWDPVKPRNNIGFWRRRELRAMNVQFGTPLCTRPGLFVFMPGNLTLGYRVGLGHNTCLFNHAPIHIGNDFLSAEALHINTGTHDPVTLIPSSSPVTIGDRVWCGARVTILAGVTIGDDVVIGAGAVVKDNIPPNSIAAGVPARVIRPLNRPPSPPVWSAFGRSTSS
ncbi:MAG: DapH/DapD/GlmU-related protein [bacterium]